MTGTSEEPRFRLECHVAATSDAVWGALVRLLDGASPDASPRASEVGGETHFGAERICRRRRLVRRGDQAGTVRCCDEGRGATNLGEQRAFTIRGSFVLDQWQLVERTLATDPPWRRVYRVVEGAPVAMYEGTESTDVNGGCQITWTMHAKPDPGKEDEFAAFITRAEVAVSRGLDALVRMATGD